MNKHIYIPIIVLLVSLLGRGIKAQSCERVQGLLEQAELESTQSSASFRDSLANLEAIFSSGECLEYLQAWSKSMFRQYSLKLQFQKGVNYYQKAYEIALQSDRADLTIQTGIAYAEGLLVLEQYHQAFEIYSHLMDMNGLSLSENARVYYGYGKTMYFLDRDAEEAIPFVEKSLEYAQLSQDSILIKNAHEAMAIIHLMNGALLSASKEYIRMEKYLSPQMKYPRLTTYHQLTEIFLDLGDLEKAMDYARKARRIAEEEQYQKMQARTNLQFARIAARSDFSKADSFFMEAMDFVKSNTVQSILDLNILYHYTKYLIKDDNLDEASRVLEQYQDLPANLHDIKPTYLFELKAELGLAEKKLDEVQVALDSLSENARKTNSPYDRLKLAQLKRNFYDSKGEIDSAYAYALASIDASQKLFEENKLRFVYDAESRYERGKQDQKIADLEAQRELTAEMLELKQRQNLGMLIGIGILLIFSGWVFYLYRVNNRKSKELSSQNKLIRKTLEEKDILLKEIHHRVKNNLQVVSSLLSLQSRFIRDEQALNAINEGKNRVKSMALIHQNLYQEDNLTGVAIKPYFEKLIRSLFDSYNIDRDRIQLDMQVDNLTLDVDSVIPIGLITNELVSNALKHAFPNSENGLVKVKLKEENNRIVLQVMDNGVGMEKPESAMESNTFGYRIINAFKEKLGAELLIENNGGTNIKIFIAHYQKARKGVLSKVS